MSNVESRSKLSCLGIYFDILHYKIEDFDNMRWWIDIVKCINVFLGLKGCWDELVPIKNSLVINHA